MAHTKPGLTLEQIAQGFGDWHEDFLEIRSDLLGQANKCPAGSACSLTALSQGVDEPKAARIGQVFEHLQRHGLNFGAPQPPKPAAADPPPEDPAVTAAKQLKETQNKILEQLYSILKEADLETLKLKDVRAKLQELGFDMAEHKAFVTRYVDKYLACRASGTDPEPVVTDDEEESEGDKPPARVVVVGAGPAGLAAASTLQRCGVEVVVLEAGEKPGGRSAPVVSSSTADGAPPVDTAHLPLLPPHLMHHLTQPSAAAGAARSIAGDAVQQALHLLHQLAKHQGVDLQHAASLVSPTGSGPALIGIRDTPLYDAYTSTWLTPDQLDQVYKVLEELLVAAKAQCEEAGQDGEFVTLRSSLTAALEKHVRKVAAAVAAAAKAKARAAAAAAKAAAAAAAAAAANVEAAAADKTADGSNAEAAAPPQVTSADATSNGTDGGGGDGDVVMADAPGAAGETAVQGSGDAAAAAAGGDGVSGDAAVQSSAQPSTTGEAPAQGGEPSSAVPAEAPAAPASNTATEASTAAAGEEGKPAAATDAQPEVEPLPDQVVRGVRWVISMLHSHTGQPLSSLALTLAPNVTLLRHTPSHNANSDGPKSDEVQLGILRPSTQRARGAAVSQRLLEGLSRDLDIRYNQQVTEVRYDDEGVTVNTKSGESLEAAAVLVCVPLAHLKEGTIKFKSALPNWKLDILGRLNPTSLVHLGASLGNTLDWPALLGPNLGQPTGQPTAADPAAVMPVFGVVPSAKTGQEAQGEVLCGLVCEGCAVKEHGTVLLANTTPDGITSKHQTQDSLRPAWLALIQKALPGVQQPETSSTWAVHPGQGEAAAGHTLPACGVTPDDMVAAVAPVKKVFFAGEWCAALPLLGSIAGALAAGVREAARLALLMKDPDSSLQVGDEAVVDEKALKAAAKARQQRQQKAMLQSLKRQRDRASDDDDDDFGGKSKGKGAAKKKSKVSKVASDDEDYEEEEEEAGGKKAGGKKSGGKKRKAQNSDDEGDQPSKSKTRRSKAGQEPKEPEPFDLLTYQQQLRQSEEARQDIKAAHKALLQAAQGEVTALLDIMQAAGSLENRQQLLHVLCQANANAVEAAAQQLRYFKTINTWLQELLDEKGPAEHLVLSLLKLLSRSPTTAAMLKSSGLVETFKTRCLEGAPKDVRKAAQDIWQVWTQRFRSTPGPSKPTTSGPSASTPATKPTTDPLLAAKTTMHAAPPKPPPQPPKTALASSTPAAGTSAAQAHKPEAGAAPSASGGGVQGVQGLPKVYIEDDPMLMALEAEEKRLEAAIQNSAARKTSDPSTTPSAAAVKLPAIRTFDEYQASKIAARGDAKGRGRGTPQPPAPAPPPAPAASAADSLSGEGVSALRDYVSRMLKPAHMDKRLSTNDFRDIRNKVMLKICEATPAAASDKHWLDGAGRKDKVKSLVDKYLSKV